MKDGLYEVKDHDSFFNVVTGYFVCRNNETTATMPTKRGALEKTVEGSAIPKQEYGKWIAPLYPADGVWKNESIYFACKDGMCTEGSYTESDVIRMASKNEFPYKSIILGPDSYWQYANVSEYISPLPTSRGKLLTGEYILTMNPPKKDFDVYVKNFGFYNEVSVEEVVRFARENHPCWERWLKERGIPFEEEIKVGDIVEVVDPWKESGDPTLANMLGATGSRYKSWRTVTMAMYGDNRHPLENKRGRVIGIGDGYALIDTIDEEVLVGIDGLRRVS